MRDKRFDRERRSFLGRMVSLVLAVCGVNLAPRRSAAFWGAKPVAQGMRKAEGEVRVNGTIVREGSAVGPDAVVSTGAGSHAVFVVGADAFLLRENSRVELSSGGNVGAAAKEKSVIRTLSMNAGKLLSVFGRGKKTFVTSTAVCGVRGTGMYVEAEADRTYVCTCYGEVDLEAAASPGARETVKTTHHQSPRYIYGKGAERPIEKAPMVMNHTDTELIMLESLVNRRPPFVRMPLNEYHDPYQ